MQPTLDYFGVGCIPWSPLARGFLAGGRVKPQEGETERSRTDQISGRLYFREADFQIVDTLSEIARARGVPNMQLALAWVLHHPAVTSPIIGATKPHHLDDAVAAVPLKLSDEELALLAKPYKPKPVIDHQ